VTGPTPRRIQRYFCQCLRLKRYLRNPGDGRPRPKIAARHLVWSMLISAVLRESSFHAIEALVCSKARRALDIGRDFGDDALAYFTERDSIPYPPGRPWRRRCRRRNGTKHSTTAALSESLSMEPRLAAVQAKAAVCVVLSDPRARLSATVIMS
jgi:hypothetical protein